MAPLRCLSTQSFLGRLRFRVPTQVLVHPAEEAESPNGLGFRVY